MLDMTLTFGLNYGQLAARCSTTWLVLTMKIIFSATTFSMELSRNYAEWWTLPGRASSSGTIVTFIGLIVVSLRNFREIMRSSMS